MAKFERKIIKEFKRLKFTPEYLIEHHSPQLRRLKLSSDMGILNFNSDQRDDEHPLYRTALHVLREFRKLPLKASYGGIPLANLHTTLEHLVRRDVNGLLDMEKELITDGLYILSAMTHGRSLEHLPYHLKTKEVCEAAVKVHGRAITSVPLPLVTEELCWVAVNSGALIEHIPPEFESERIILYCIESTLCRFASIDQRYCKPHRMLKIVSSNPNFIQFIPDEILTLDICRTAVEADPNCLHYLPPEIVAEIEVELLKNRKKHHTHDGMSFD